MIVSDTFVMKNEQLDIIDKGFEKILALKDDNPDLKIMITNTESGFRLIKVFEDLVSKPENVNTFVDSVVSFLQKYKFDGLLIQLQFAVRYIYFLQNKFPLLLVTLDNALRNNNYLFSASISKQEVIHSKGNGNRVTESEKSFELHVKIVTVI